MARLYHPDLGVEIEVADDESVIAIHAEAGWLPAPEREASSPAHAPDPVKYVPVEPDAAPKPVRKSTK
jgi:hypothetical protein